MIASPKNSAAPTMPIARISRPAWDSSPRASAISDSVPPSPLLSARSTKATYLTVTMTVSAQTISDSTPSTSLGLDWRAAGRGVQRLAERVDRAGADVAVDHAERAEHQQREFLAGRMASWRSRLRPSARSRGRDRHFRQGPFNTSPSEGAGSDSPVATRKQSDSLPTLRQPKSYRFAAHQPQALRKRRTVSAMPYSSASAVKACPIETSARAGMRRASAGRLATVRSWPALTASPAAKRRLGRFAQSFQFLGGLCGIVVSSRRMGQCRVRRGRRRARARRPCRPDRDRRTARRGSRPSSAAARSA